MGSSLELRKSSSYQHYPKVGKERVLLPQDPEKLKMKSPARPRGHLYYASRKETDSVREKQGKSVKGNPIGDDELVRHMSNLPGYLLRGERGEKMQEKVLNVGVLDWGRLENWKHKQMNVPIKDKRNALCSRDNLSLKQITRPSTFHHVVRSETSAKRHSSLHSGLISSHKEHSHCVSSVQNAIHSQNSDGCSKSTMKGWPKTQRTTSTPSRRNNSNMMHERERTKSSHRKISSEMANSSSQVRHSSPKGSAHFLDGQANNRTEKLVETNTQNKYVDERIILEVGQTASKSHNDMSHFSNYHMHIENSETEKTGRQCSDIDLTQQYFINNQDANLLKLKTKHLDEEFQPLDFRASIDENVADGNSSIYSEIFSPVEILSSECPSEIPYSCPLPSLADTETVIGTIQDCPVNDSSEELSTSMSLSSCYPDEKSSLWLSEGKLAEDGKSNAKLAHSQLVDSLEALDDETTEQGAKNGRHPSPNRRFSFSLGRMGRSFSFKESSTVPQLSSTYVSQKSGPVISDITSLSDHSDRKKVNGHNRTRSSPLRRLIEPILKHKSSTPQHRTEGNFNSLSFWPSRLHSAPQKKHAASSIQALLQFTINNGFPLFKLLVDNHNILAATIKDLTSSEKNDLDQNYTFYSVNEIKRKSAGWIRPGSRERSYGYAYNVIGQMKVNSELRSECDNGKYMLRESVLFGVEMRPSNQESATMVKNRELAAVVLKVPIEKLNPNSQQGEKVLTEDHNPVIILPGAHHGSPTNGEPSPLINRWRSGGSCDCGGWDVGCKLRILSIPKKLITSKARPIPDHFELSILGGQENKPVFSLAPLKGGIFEVHFDSSISMLQAFFTCVTVLSCQQLADLSEPSKIAPEVSIKYPNSNGTNANSEKAPVSVRYAPNPPHSPVGRV